MSITRSQNVGKLINRQVVIALKTHADNILETKTDLVCFSNRTDKGITDLSFEKYKSKKRVSLYFTSNNEGIKAYQRTAALVSSFDNVELHFTPHFGQSRISFDWNDFWEKLDDSTLSFILPNSLLTLPPSKVNPEDVGHE
jgi:hypothetical protein